MSYSEVWLNGQFVGGWPYGYASFRLNLTPYAKPGGNNVLAIRLDNPPASSRWYPGGGLYRNVWLVETAPVHVGQWGTYITTPEVSSTSARVILKVTVDILPHWTWPERVGQITLVHVYTSGDEAELFLNGKSLRRRKKTQFEYRLRWDDVVYQPGELRVIASKNGKEWANDSVKTSDGLREARTTVNASV
jgi:beta-galactosidase/beta-glucuronidase